MYTDPKIPARGIVSLVGAGQGATDLLTLRAPHLLSDADVIVHDRLMREAALALARPEAQSIFVGKARANHRMPQADINALLVRLARVGKRVVRLKGGRPTGVRPRRRGSRGPGRGVRYEIVPGITAALACAANAGIPLTHRETSRSVMLTTGHTKNGTLDPDFAAPARPGARLSVYMGIHTLPLLLDGLRRHGFDPATPAALVERGGTPARRALFGILPDLLARASAWSTGGPALVLIGAVGPRGAERARHSEDRCEQGGTWNGAEC
jgi:uroporphyrin-III C-methyltransferase / precorrin-2 dehydrogenase / sirohydrochlorin ferrochelatase